MFFGAYGTDLAEMPVIHHGSEHTGTGYLLTGLFCKRIGIFLSGFFPVIYQSVQATT